MDVPQDIEVIYGKPGKDWSEEERGRVLDWLGQRSQLKLVWYSAARYLGEGAIAQDVEDAVSQLYLNFDPVRRSYRPRTGIRFHTYLLNVCFRNYCVAQGKKIRRRRSMERSLEPPAEEVSPYRLELEDTSADANPERQAQSRAFLENLSHVLDGLPEKQRQVFVLRHFENLSYDEIAARMQVPLGSVKSWLHQATGRVREELKNRGWFQGE